MTSPALPQLLLLIIVAISILLMLLRPRDIPEAYWIAGGVLALLILRLLPIRLAVHAVTKALDVCLFLIGMMLLSELAREHGIFDWLSSAAVSHAGGSCGKLFALVYAVGTLVTVFMSNDATAVVLTPAILTAVRKAKADPLPHLFVCAFIANAASFLLPISNPANLVVFHSHMPTLGRWLIAFGLPCVLSIGVTFVVMRCIFRDELRTVIATDIEPRPLTPDGKLVLGGIIFVVVVLLAASSLGKDLGWPTFLATLAISGIASIYARKNPLKLAKEISWETLALVAGLFVMVEAIETAGALQHAQYWLLVVQQFGPTTAALITGFAIAFANNLVNNLPLGLIAGSTLQASHTTGLIANVVLIGVDLGPNLSITGSLATILWLIALRKEGIRVSFWDFLKVGVVTMPLALLASLISAILLNRWFGS
ncbi:MAG TPA: arsenic transporter [Candidatus Sulfotelmatobacter sp.]